MAEILSIAAAVLGVSDIAARSIARLLSLQSSYKSAHLMITIIIGHLTTVKAALKEIADWAANSPGSGGHKQLIVDIGNAVGSCEIIVVALDERIDSLTQSSSGDLNFKAKLSYALEEQSIKTFSDHLSNQVHALHLLVAAANCRTTDEQIALLQNHETRRAFRQIEDDSSSYIRPHSHVNSLLTRRSVVTDTSEGLDIDFVFDPQIINSDVYRRALRSALTSSKQAPTVRNFSVNHTDALGSELDPVTEESSSLAGVSTERDATSNRVILPTPLYRGKSKGAAALPIEFKSEQASSSQNQAIRHGNRGFNLLFFKIGRKEEKVRRENENAREEELDWATRVTKINKQVRVVILGTGESGKSSFLKAMRIHHGDIFSPDEKELFRDVIFSNLIQGMHDVLDYMQKCDIAFEKGSSQHYLRRIVYRCSYDLEGKMLPPEVSTAIAALLTDGGVQQCLSRANEFNLPDCVELFIAELERISSPTYSPTDDDIIRSRQKTIGITEKVLGPTDKALRVFDVGGYRSERRKWPLAYKNVQIVVLTVDIAEFDQKLSENGSISRMEESLTVFDLLVNSAQFKGTKIVLLFTKGDKLRKKVRLSAMGTWFTDFLKSDPTFGDVKAYIAYQFCRRKRSPTQRIAVVFGSFFEGRDPVLMVGEALRRLESGNSNTREQKIVVIDGTESLQSLESINSWQQIERRYELVTGVPNKQLFYQIKKPTLVTPRPVFSSGSKEPTK